MSYSHSRQPDLPVTHSSPLSYGKRSDSSLLPLSLKPHYQGRVMCFVGGTGNIAIAAALPHHLLCIVLKTANSLCNFSILFFMPARGFGFWMWRQTLARIVLWAVCRILCSNMRGLAGNLSDLTVASSQYDILLCYETLVSDLRHVSELLVPGSGRPVLLYRGKMPQAIGMAAYVRDGYGVTNTNLSVFLGFVV